MRIQNAFRSFRYLIARYTKHALLLTATTEEPGWISRAVATINLRSRPVLATVAAAAGTSVFTESCTIVRPSRRLRPCSVVHIAAYRASDFGFRIVLRRYIRIVVFLVIPGDFQRPITRY